MYKCIKIYLMKTYFVNLYKNETITNRRNSFAESMFTCVLALELM